MKMKNEIVVKTPRKGKKLESESTTKYVAKSFFWSTISKITSAVIQIISVPLLLSNFGQFDFGLIVLASSVNAYMTLLDMGVSTGAVKYFSEWTNRLVCQWMDEQIEIWNCYINVSCFIFIFIIHLYQ